MAAYRHEDTERLVEKAKGGEKKALAELIQRYQTFLASFIGVRIGVHLHGTLGADDVLQETFARVSQALSGFEWRGEPSFKSWLTTIAERVVLEGVRRQQKQPAQLNLDLAARAPSPSRVARREERFSRLEDALEGLSPDHRQVILLARVEGLKVKEIARRMNRSPDAVKKLLSRALKALKECFGDTESFHLPQRPLGAEGLSDSGE
jgi:RNA polymerase sigma-70 factor (ECF subfamily)